MSGKHTNQLTQHTSIYPYSVNTATRVMKFSTGKPDENHAERRQLPAGVHFRNQIWFQASVGWLTNWLLGHTISSSPASMERQQWNRTLPRHWTTNRFVSSSWRAQLTYLGETGEKRREVCDRAPSRSRTGGHRVRGSRTATPRGKPRLPHPVGLCFPRRVDVLVLARSFANLGNQEYCFNWKY